MAFRVGQKVICVSDDPDPLGRPVIVIKDQIYTVADVFDFRGEVGVLLVEVSPGCATGWLASLFRPIVERKTDISIFTALLAPASKEMEPA